MSFSRTIESKKKINEMKHPHADLIAEFAKDCQESDKPWELWEWSPNGEKWQKLYEMPAWNEEAFYKRKPKTININGFNVPTPLNENSDLSGCDSIFFPSLFSIKLYDSMSIEPWNSYIKEYLKTGVAHKTKEAAILHSKALLSFKQTQ